MTPHFDHEMSMTTLDTELKLQVISIAISSLTYEFRHVYGRFHELGELEDFGEALGAKHGALEAVLNARNQAPAGPFCRILEKYPNFWVDLVRNLGYESITRRDRPARDVT